MKCMMYVIMLWLLGKIYNMMDSFILDWVSWVQSTISVVFL